jgi:hypothetical protein
MQGSSSSATFDICYKEGSPSLTTSQCIERGSPLTYRGPKSALHKAVCPGVLPGLPITGIYIVTTSGFALL